MDNNNRHHKRVRTSFHMKLRGVDVRGQEFEQVVVTVDISKAGACFVSDKDLSVGSEVFLAIPLPATVVRIDKFENSPEKRYGVFFKPYRPDETD